MNKAYDIELKKEIKVDSLSTNEKELLKDKKRIDKYKCHSCVNLLKKNNREIEIFKLPGLDLTNHWNSNKYFFKLIPRKNKKTKLIDKHECDQNSRTSKTKKIGIKNYINSITNLLFNHEEKENKRKYLKELKLAFELFILKKIYKNCDLNSSNSELKKLYKKISLSKCEWSDLRKNYLRLISAYQEEFKKIKILEFELFYLYRENKDEIVLKQANNTKLFFYFSQKSKFKNLLYLGTNFQELNKNQNYRYLSSHLGDYIENYSENKDSFLVSYIKEKIQSFKQIEKNIKQNTKLSIIILNHTDTQKYQIIGNRLCVLTKDSKNLRHLNNIMKKTINQIANDLKVNNEIEIKNLNEEYLEYIKKLNKGETNE